MIVRYYGIKDTIQKEYVRTITSQNDAVAERAVQYIVRDPNFDRIAGKDYVLDYIYSFDSVTGEILDNNLRLICSFASALNAFLFEEAMKKEEKEEVKEDGKGE